jgi:N-acetylneuraminate lyase
MPVAASLEGVHVALLSGFSDGGAFSAERQANITDYVLRQRVDGLYVGGSSAEAAIMQADELAEQQAVVIDRARGRIKTLIAQVGQPALRDTVRLAKNAAALGYDAVSALPPYAFPYRLDDVKAYYGAVANAAGLPLIIYEVPHRTGRATPLADMDEILQIEGVVGLKYTSPDLYLLSRLQGRFPQILFFFGIDEMFGAAAALGISGGIGTTYNVIGGLYKEMVEAVARADLERMRKLQSVSQDLVERILAVGVIPGTKKLLQLAGVDCGQARAPLSLGPADQVEALEAWFRTGIIDEWLA